MASKYDFPDKLWGEKNNNKSSLSIVIGEDGSIVYDGYDIGSDVERLAPGADTDYEYSVTVDGKHQQKVLLELLKDFMPDDSDFAKWLKTKNIPYEFWSY